MPETNGKKAKNRRDPYDPKTGATGGDTEPDEDLGGGDEVKKHGDAIEPLIDRTGDSTRRDRGGNDRGVATETTKT